MERISDETRFPIPKKLNLLMIACQLVAMFSLFYGASLASSWWHLLLLAFGFGIVGNAVYSVIHEAEHRILHPNPKVNDFLGAAMALFFPAPYHLLRQGHIAHHRYNRSDNEAFDLYFDGDRPIVKWLKLYGIITGVYWLTVILSNVVVLVFPFLLKRRYYEFDRPLAAFMDFLNPRYWWMIKIEAILAIVLHALIVWRLEIPPLHYAVVYFGFGFSWSAMQYVHHFGAERHVVRGTRNLWLFAPIDLVWLNHNWHLTHHQHPTVSWIYLPEIAQQEDPHREFLPWHYLRMWRGPRYTDEHVENKYAGRIIN
jgi:fatty acid desaturase